MKYPVTTVSGPAANGASAGCSRNPSSGLSAAFVPADQHDPLGRVTSVLGYQVISIRTAARFAGLSVAHMHRAAKGELSNKPKARELGFGDVNFQVLRRFQTSEGRRAGIDDKVAADQRGHTVGVALATYTRTALEQKQQAVQTLESHLYGKAKTSPSDENCAVKQ